jgi:hypothetical protein
MATSSRGRGRNNCGLLQKNGGPVFVACVALPRPCTLCNSVYFVQQSELVQRVACRSLMAQR